MKIWENIYMLEVKVNFMGNESIINPVVIWEENNKVLIDTGFPRGLEDLEKAFEKDGLNLRELNKIILTHQDIDHVGSARVIKEMVKGLEIFVLEEEIPYINGEKDPHKFAKMKENKENLPADMMQRYEMVEKGFAYSKVEVDKALKDGEILPYAGGIEVIHMPGHTIGHTCLYIKEAKILVAGDMLFTENGKLKKGSGKTNFNNEVYEKSLKKLLDYDIKQLVLYHGGLIKDEVNEAIKEII